MPNAPSPRTLAKQRKAAQFLSERDSILEFACEQVNTRLRAVSVATRADVQAKKSAEFPGMRIMPDVSTSALRGLSGCRPKEYYIGSDEPLAQHDADRNKFAETGNGLGLAAVAAFLLNNHALVIEHEAHQASR